MPNDFRSQQEVTVGSDTRILAGPKEQGQDGFITPSSIGNYLSGVFASASALVDAIDRIDANESNLSSHSHLNDANIGGPYSLNGHVHGYASLVHNHDLDYPTKYDFDNHHHDDSYPRLTFHSYQGQGATEKVLSCIGYPLLILGVSYQAPHWSLHYYQVGIVNCMEFVMDGSGGLFYNAVTPEQGLVTLQGMDVLDGNYRLCIVGVAL